MYFLVNYITQEDGGLLRIYEVGRKSDMYRDRRQQ
jgi:hypothetical protein